MPFDIVKESQKQTPLGNMLKEVINSDFSLCYQMGDENEIELIFHDPKHALLMYAFSIDSSLRILRLYGEIAKGYEHMTVKQMTALSQAHIYKPFDEYTFFEANAKESLSFFINEFIPLFDFCNPWHSTLDHVSLCNPGEVARPGTTYPKIITGHKIFCCGLEVSQMIPNSRKTDWYTYYEKSEN